jgi:hypothetical protein
MIDRQINDSRAPLARCGTLDTPAFHAPSATRPNTFWVSLGEIDFHAGAPVVKLTLANGEVYAGDVARSFKPAQPFAFMGVAP